MVKKICNTCNEEKSTDDFYFRNKKEGKLHGRCKICSEQSRKNKEHYEKYKDDYKARSKVRKKKVINENTDHLLAYLEHHPCVDCGNTNPIVLEFDHLDRKEKEFTISSKMSDYSWDRIMTEIKKCEVVCSNCHKIRTANQFGWRKLKKFG